MSQTTDKPLKILNNQWLFSKDHNQVCRVIETQDLWGIKTSLVYLPSLDIVARVPNDRLHALEGLSGISKHGIIEKAAVAKISEALSQNTLLAPITSSVIPLPHQVRALTRALSHDRVRYLLADEVGLGKTIEAGLIMRELKLRGMAQRTLIIAPKSLATQWVGEMRLHFNEDFKLVTPDEIQRFSKFLGASADFLRDTKSEVTIANPWRMFSQIVVPMDSVKPLEKRQGWSAQQIQEYNSQR
ncbi:MAG: SNF2-related protein, partial [Pseudomonadota bacterium]